MDKVIKASNEIIEKLEKEKLEEIAVYTVEIGYNRWSTTDKDSAFSLWQALSEGFFTLENLGSDYSGPKFRYKKPIEVKLVGERVTIWKDQESAQRAHNAFEAMKETAIKKSKEE